LWISENSGWQVTIFIVACEDKIRRKLSIMVVVRVSRTRQIPEGRRIGSNYGWLYLVEPHEYEAILYLSASSLLRHGFFHFSQNVSNSNIPRERITLREKKLSSITRRKFRDWAKWNCTNINVVNLLDVTAIVSVEIYRDNSHSKRNQSWQINLENNNNNTEKLKLYIHNSMYI